MPATFQARGRDVFASEPDAHVPTRNHERFAALAHSHLQVPGYPHTVAHTNLAGELNIPVASVISAASRFMLRKLK